MANQTSGKDGKGRELICSFCGRSQNEVEQLVIGPGVNICKDCIEMCCNVLERDGERPAPPRAGMPPRDRRRQAQKPGADYGADPLESIHILTPAEIKAGLDQYVIGQDAAKKVLAVSVYNHYKRILSGQNSDVELQKSNVLMLGPSGTGKTLLAQTLAKMLNVPFAIADATTLTEAGYVGEDVENILLKLIQAADFDIPRAEIGIIYVDEIDKITRKSENPSITRDVGGEGVQQALLKIVEGTVSNVPPNGGRKHPQQEFIRMNTGNILFIVGGAFIGLDKIVEQRMRGGSMGFGAKVRASKDMPLAELLEKIHPQDLVQFGLIPEFVGRIPIITHVDELDEPDLVRILTEPKNALVRQYQKLFELDNVTLRFTSDALRAIAHRAIERKTGARGLRNVMEKIMLDIMFKLPSMPNVKECLINRAVIEKGKEPVLLYGDGGEAVNEEQRLSEDKAS